MLIETKLRPPVLRTGLVERDRLIRVLDGALAMRLTVLTAPAGFGKSTLLGQWISVLRERDAAVGWLALGIIFLAYGIWRGAGVARLASAILVLLAVIKVFVFDLAGLTGLWRALSFITLGGVLIGIGLAYQKLVFARPPPSPPAPGDAAPTNN